MKKLLIAAGLAAVILCGVNAFAGWSLPWDGLTGVPSLVNTFNGRSGAVTPQAGDYTPAFIGAQPALGYTPENVANKAAASGYPSLNSSSKVVQDPANATATPAAGKIPFADGSGTLNSWITSFPWGSLTSVPSMVNTFNGRSGMVTPQAGDYTATLVGLPTVTNDPQLKRAAGDFASFSNKASPNSSDLLLIEDSAAAGVKKNIAIGNLPNAPLTPPATSSFSLIPGTLPSAAYWQSIAWNGTVYCALSGNSSSTSAATSSNGLTWTAQTMPATAAWSSIAWNGTNFCAVASGRTSAATSPDGHTWTIQTMPSAVGWSAIAWNGTVFCAIATGSTTVAATSPDGHTWTAQTMPSSSNWHSIAWNGTVFCAVAGGGSATTVAATSPDGHTWTAQTMPSSVAWYAIAWNGTSFCAVAGLTSVAATSPDGHTWTTQTMPASTSWTGIAWNGTVFCAIANGISAAISPDGHTWTAQTMPAAAYWYAIASDGSTFCAVSGNGSAEAAVSTGQLLKNNNAGGFTGAVPGVDYSLPLSPSPTSAALGADVTMTSANTYYDGPSIDLTAGTWLVEGTALVTSSNPGILGVKLWNGTTVSSSGQYSPYQSAASMGDSISISGIVTVASAIETWKISCASAQTGGIIRAACTANGAGNNATTIKAVKIQ